MLEGIGFSELLLVCLLGLIILGPERLPHAISSIQSFIKYIKQTVGSVKDELEHELKIEQLHADLKKAESSTLEQLSPEIEQSVEALKNAAQSVNRPFDKISSHEKE